MAKNLFVSSSRTSLTRRIIRDHDIGQQSGDIARSSRFGFGDSRRPVQETAVLIEEIAHQQMDAMTEEVWEVAKMRGDKHVGIEDILFLIRKDKVKLKRLLRFYEVRDLKNVIKSTVGSTEDVTTRADLSIVSMQEKQALDTRVLSKSRQICYEFLSSIDQTGELVALFDDKEIDTVKHERMLRAELQFLGIDTEQYMEFCQARQTSFKLQFLGIDTEQYMEFCQARQTSFSRRFKLQRFRDWLQINMSPNIVLSAAAIEIFSYLAYETVAQIVDLALLVKQDMRANAGDPLSRTRPALCVSYTELYAGSLYGKSEAISAASQSPPYDSSNTIQMNATSGTSSMQISAPMTPNKLNKKKRKKSGPPTTVEMSWNCTILPADVREAMRRYFTDISPFASQTKINPHCSPWYRTLCS